MENDQITSYNGNSNAQSYQGNYQPYNLGYNANTGYGYNTSLTDPFPTRMFQPNSTGIYQSIFGQVSPTPYQLKLDNYAHTAPDYAALQKPTGNPGTDINPIQQTDNWWQKTYKNIGGRQGLMGIGNSALSAASAFLPGKSELKGPNAGLTAGLDSAYDAAANAVSTINPLIGGIMKANGFVNKGLNAIGGGTDGMCVCAGTKIFKANGEIINIEDLRKEDGIIGWDNNSKQIVPQLIHNFIEPRQKKCLEIVLKNGYTIRCSIDHPILSDNSPKAKSRIINGKRIAIRPWEFRRADELKVGDFVGLANNIDYWGDINVPNAYIVGLLIGDGSYGKSASCRLCSADPDTWKYLENNNLGVLNHCDDSRPEKYNKEFRTYRIIEGMELLHQLGIAYQTGKNKTLPKNIGKFNKVSVCNLLAGLFDADGSIYINEKKQSYIITLYQSNINLLEEVRMQLHKLGIFSTIGTRKAAKYKLGDRIINSDKSYRLQIHDISSVINFYNLIPLNISYKKESLEKIYNMVKGKRVQEHNDISGAKQCKIVSIIPIGIQTVYNLQADYNHTYLANCIITHNTKADSILGSAFFTPIGAVNGFFGKRAKSFYQNEFLKAQAGDSYNATDYTMDEASKKQNKKYGLISGAARRRANSEIDEAARQQNALSGIIDDSSTRTALQSSMNMVNSNKLALDLQGGVSSNLLQMAKKGAVLRRVQNIVHPSIIEKQEDPDFSKFKATLPEGLVPDGYMLEESWRYNDKPLTFEEALDNTNMFLPGTDGLGLKVNSMAYNPNTEEYQYMYPSDHAKAIKFKDWLDTPDSDYFKEIYKKNPNKPFLSFQANEPTVRSAAFVPFPGTSYNQIDEDAVQTNKEKWLEYLEEHPLNVQLSHGQIAKYKGTVLSKIPNAATNLEIASYLSGDPYNVLSQIQIAQIEKQLFEQGKDKSEKKEDKKEEKKEEPKSPEKYQKGGSLNIIPDGALHARKHSIDMENITKKGIPVVAEQDGQVVQQAEVEKEEIIFRYSVTQKLENLKQKYDETNDDQYAIAAGKLLTKEIIYNTQDNTQVLL